MNCFIDGRICMNIWPRVMTTATTSTIGITNMIRRIRSSMIIRDVWHPKPLIVVVITTLVPVVQIRCTTRSHHRFCFPLLRRHYPLPQHLLHRLERVVRTVTVVVGIVIVRPCEWDTRPPWHVHWVLVGIRAPCSDQYPITIIISRQRRRWRL